LVRYGSDGEGIIAANALRIVHDYEGATGSSQLIRKCAALEPIIEGRFSTLEVGCTVRG